MERKVKENIDYLVLGCSHYPYLIPQIKKILPENIKIIDSGQAVARQTQKILDEKIGFHSENVKSQTVFYTNSNPKVLSDVLNNQHKIEYKEF